MFKPYVNVKLVVTCKALVDFVNIVVSSCFSRKMALAGLNRDYLVKAFGNLEKKKKRIDLGDISRVNAAVYPGAG